MEFTTLVSEVGGLPETWRAVLSATPGVYVLVDPEDGEQYVGSATGGDGLLGRWVEYARDGHGGNVELRRRGRRDYRIGILEVCGSASTEVDILEREGAWKRKLGSRAHGLNRN